jgi:hypothetical protein
MTCQAVTLFLVVHDPTLQELLQLQAMQRFEKPQNINYN